MKKMAMGLLACSLCWTAGADELKWMTDLPKAQAKAKAEHKWVMMDFTGSDWCPGCIALNKEIFSTAEFAKYAENNLVPVQVDFPHHKTQSAELKKANEALTDKFKIEGFPTVVFLNPDGKKVGELHGVEGGPKAFIAEFEKLKGKS